MAQTSWTQQWERMLRWRGRVESHRTGYPVDTPIDMGAWFDDLIAVFQSVWHLKDWLYNDQSTALSKAQVENTVDQESDLLLIADVCNGAKHLGRIARQPAGGTGLDARLGTGHVELNVGGENSGIRLTSHWIELNDGTMKDAFAALDDGIGAWRRVLPTFGLAPPC